MEELRAGSSDEEIMTHRSVIEKKGSEHINSSRESNHSSSSNINNNQDEEVVAVGSISHVLKTAFKDFFVPPPSSSPEPAATTTEDTDELPEEAADDDDDGTSVDNADEVSTKAEEEEVEEVVETPVTDKSDEPHPYVIAGRERLQVLHDKVQAQHRQARDLMSLLSTSHTVATAADEVEARNLQAQGLVVKSQIPIGQSRLEIPSRPSLSESFGTFGTNLVIAKEFFIANHEEMLLRSGNGPDAQKKAVTYVAEPPGYLKQTSSLSVRNAMTLERHPDRKSSSKTSPTKQKAKTLLKPTLTGDELDENDRILKNMKQKLNFLKNPRFDTSSNNASKSITTGGTNVKDRDTAYGNRGYFSLNPPKFIFQNYVGGETYKQVLRIKNVSAVSRRIRVLPPSSEFFSVASVTYPTTRRENGGGLLAPGMDCRVEIQFAPETPSDYFDKIVIESDVGPSLNVSISAIREPPVLSIPSVISTGPCFVGGVNDLKVPCHNSGGSAKFWIVSKTKWEENEKNSEGIIASVGDNFWISPSEFELGTGEGIEFHVRYAPRTIGEDGAEFVMICDNCQIKTYELRGTGCEVLLRPSQIDSKVLLRDCDDTNIPLSLFRSVSFGSITPGGASKQRTVHFENNTPLPLSYSWKLQSNEFTITPKNGVLPSKSDSVFTITYHPDTLASFKTTTQLLVKEIPASAIANPDQQDALSTLRESTSSSPPPYLVPADFVAYELDLVGDTNFIPLELSPKAIGTFDNKRELCVGESYEKILTISNPSDSACTVAWQKPHLTLRTNKHADLVPWPSLEEEEELMTAAVVVPVPVPAEYEVGITISPKRSVTIPPHSSQDFVLQVTPHRQGSYKAVIQCNVEHNPYPLEVTIPELHVVGTVLKFDTPEVNFGLVAVGGSTSQTLTLRNDSDVVPTRFVLRHIESTGPVNRELKRTGSNESLLSRYSMASSSASKASSNAGAEIPLRCLVAFEPNTGTVPPNSVTTVTITCTAGKTSESFRGSIECVTAHNLDLGQASFIRMRAEIQAPKVYLSTSRFNFGTTFVGVSVSKTVELVNLSNLSASFKWLQPGGHSPSYTLEYEPKRGTLESKERQSVVLKYTPKAPGKIEALVACNIRGMMLPLGIQINTVQKGLVLSYKILEANESIPPPPINSEEVLPLSTTVPKLNFGDNVNLFERRTIRLLIQNFSGIEANVNLRAKKYSASTRSLLSSSSSSSTISTRSSTTRLLGDAHESTDLFTSEAGKNHVTKRLDAIEDREILKSGDGVAFVASPESLVIPPWEQQEVSLVCFNNMPGKYADTIVSQVDGMPPTRLTTTINVIGCPLSFDRNTVGLNAATDPLTFNFGNLPFNSEIVTKNLRVINSGPLNGTLNFTVTALRDSPPDVASLGMKVSSDGKVKLSIVSKSTSDTPPIPYCVTPHVLRIRKHSSAILKISFAPPSEPSGVCNASLIADADWETTTAAEPLLSESDSSVSLESNSSHRSSLKAAVGMAYRAVRSMAPENNSATITTSLESSTPGALKCTLSSNVTTPHLQIDKVGKDPVDTGRIKFTAWSTQPSRHRSHIRSIVLRNQMGTASSFTISTDGPYNIYEYDKTFKTTKKKGICLPSGESIQLSVVFLPQREMLNPVVKGTKLKRVMDGELQIGFDNGYTQRINLYGVVLKPMVVVSPSEYCFGKMHITATRKLALFLSNPTIVPASWTVRHVPAQVPRTRAQKAAAEAAKSRGELVPMDDPSVFQMSRTSGEIIGPTLPLGSAGHVLPLDDANRAADAGKCSTDRMPFEVGVTFHPAAVGRYKCRFVIDVNQGEGFEVVLEGFSTLDETGHIAADRPTLTTKTFDHSNLMLIDS